MDLVARLESERDRAAASLLYERAAELHQMATTLRTLHGKRRHLRSAAHVQNFVVVVHDELRVGAGGAQVLAFSGARLQGQVVVQSGLYGRDDERRRAALAGIRGARQVTIAGATAQAAGLLEVLDNSPYFEGSEFQSAPARSDKEETFRIRAKREAGK